MTIQKATQAGAEGEEKELSEEQKVQLAKEGTTKAFAARNAVMDEIMAGRNAQLEADNQEANPEGEGDEQQTDEDQDDGVQEQGQEQGRQGQEVKTRKLKVDGQEIDVEEDKIMEAGVRALQKESAADKRLEEATRILKEAQEQAKVFKNNQPSSQDADAGKNNQPSDDLDVDELANTIINGDKSEVREALSKIVGSRVAKQTADATASMTPQQIYNMVNGAMETRNALELFQTDADKGGFGDLYKDETLRQLVLDKEQKLYNDQPNMSAKDRLIKVASEVRAWRDSFIPKGNGKVEGFDETSTRKQGMSTTTTTAGSRTAQKQDVQNQTIEANRSNAIEAMAKARGQRTA